MKFLTLILVVFISQATQAASIKYYESEEASKVSFKVLNSENILSIDYDEDDKELSVWPTTGQRYDFKVDSLNKAEEIIKKVFDKNDHSFITLIKS